jgi:hypothetical protein
MRNEKLETKKTRCIHYTPYFLFLIFYFSFFIPAHAAMLTQVRDLIGTSQPSVQTPHIIQFTTTTAIPVSGKIVLTPEVFAFTIPFTFDFEDVDLSVSTSSGYVERTLAATPTGSADGVAVATGNAGNITITLNSTEAIPAGAQVRLTLGTLAVHGASSTVSIVNPTPVGSYRLRLQTLTASNASIDFGTAMIVIVAPVTMGVTPPELPPIRSNGLPTGTVAANNAQIELSLSTNEFASCRYATSTGVLYSNMTGLFPQSSSLNFYVTLTGFVNSTTYTYYVRCADLDGTENDDDYPISFTLAATPTSNTSIVVDEGGGGRGGVGEFRGGSDVLYRASVTLSGWTAPLSTVTVVQDGKALTPTATARSDGGFSYEVTGLERGTYTFFVYSEDRAQKRSGIFTSTLTLGQGTQNVISAIVLPPTLSLSKTSVDVGERVAVSGTSVPGSVVQLVLQRNVENRTLSDVRKFTATTSSATSSTPGVWSVTVDTQGLARGTYEVKAAAHIPGVAQSSSGASRTATLGVGEQPQESTGNPDLNQDGKVNLIDFSIFLTLFGPAGRADFNDDGKTNLGDLSIMLFAWTG